VRRIVRLPRLRSPENHCTEGPTQVLHNRLPLRLQPGGPGNRPGVASPLAASCASRAMSASRIGNSMIDPFLAFEVFIAYPAVMGDRVDEVLPVRKGDGRGQRGQGVADVPTIATPRTPDEATRRRDAASWRRYAASWRRYAASWRRVTANEARVAANEARVAANEGRVAANEARVMATKGRYAATERRVALTRRRVVASERRDATNEATYRTVMTRSGGCLAGMRRFIVPTGNRIVLATSRHERPSTIRSRRHRRYYGRSCWSACLSRPSVMNRMGRHPWSGLPWIATLPTRSTMSRASRTTPERTDS